MHCNSINLIEDFQTSQIIFCNHVCWWYHRWHIHASAISELGAPYRTPCPRSSLFTNQKAGDQNELRSPGQNHYVSKTISHTRKCFLVLKQRWRSEHSFRPLLKLLMSFILLMRRYFWTNFSTLTPFSIHPGLIMSPSCHHWDLMAQLG